MHVRLSTFLNRLTQKHRRTKYLRFLKLKARAIEEVEERPMWFKSKRKWKQLRSLLWRRRLPDISPTVITSGTDSHEFSSDSSMVSVNIRSEFWRVVLRKKFKNASRNCDEAGELSDVERGDGSKSEVSSASRLSFPANDLGKHEENRSSVEATQHDVALEIHAVNKIIRAKIANSTENGGVPLHSGEETDKISENEAESEDIQFPKLEQFHFDLACSKQFSKGGFTYGGGGDEAVNNSSSSMGIFHIVSSSECGSQFLEKSMEDESSSPTFELFRHFKQQFCRSTFALKECDDHNSSDIHCLGLENEQDEEIFKMIWKRERRQVYVHNYAEEYCNNTAYGELVIKQRGNMVQWIVEQATDKELQKETMFLGVSLLDRFLSKGYFKDVGNLQIDGIVCLALATRIEENRPNNWFFLEAARANENTEKTAKYLAVLNLMRHQQLCYWPSTVAAGLVVLASIATNQDASSHLVTEIHARHNDKDLPKCIKSMECLVEYL